MGRGDLQVLGAGCDGLSLGMVGFEDGAYMGGAFTWKIDVCFYGEEVC